MLRKAQVAGQFYPASKEKLLKEIDRLINPNLPREKVLGAVLPHAGYIYSGAVAGEVFSKIELTETLVIIGPNHTGLGKSFSLMVKGRWQTPLGEIPVNQKVAELILENSRYLQNDFLAHQHEHSVEVQLPFIQRLREKFNFVPIVIAEAEFAVFKNIGEELARVISSCKEDILILASSDMTHYESQADAEKKDRLAIEAILGLDEELLYRRVREYGISMCGYAPCICMLSAAKKLGASNGELLRYQTSGDSSGDYSSVVGYAGITIK